MKYVISRYNHDLSWLSDYTTDYVLYDRSPESLAGAIVVPNLGSDLLDKFTYIIDNYDNLPNVAVYTKANLFKYITKREFDFIKDNTTFTPILTDAHAEVVCDAGMPEPGKPFSFYKDGMYYELNWPAYLKNNPAKDQPTPVTMDWYLSHPLVKLLKIDKLDYLPFAPGSNYILPKANILQHPKELYEQLRSYLDWDIYPGEAMIIERGLFTLFSKEEKNESVLDNTAIGVSAR